MIPLTFVLVTHSGIYCLGDEENLLMAILNNISSIEQFIVDKSDTTNLSKKWVLWKEDFTLFVEASGVTKDGQKKALLLRVAGKEWKEIYRSLDPVPNDNYQDEYFIPKKNLRYERYLLKKAQQKTDEDTATYITRLKRLSDSCEYNDAKIEIGDHFIATCKSTKLRKNYLVKAT